MKINVNDKTEKIVLGKITELRGNFKAIETEEGTSYECDMYRTKSNKTFKELYNAEQVEKAYSYLSSTDWIYAKCIEEDLVASEKYPTIVSTRKAMRALINELED